MKDLSELNTLDIDFSKIAPIENLFTGSGASNILNSVKKSKRARIKYINSLDI